MPIARLAAPLALLLTALPAAADTVPVETATADGVEVRLHLHPFLTPEELATLRLVATNAEARAIFVPTGAGFAALAVAPAEGFVRDALPVDSAVAVGGAATAEGAAKDAREGCDARRKADTPCVLVLEVAAR
jgi:hypothetical protein